MALFNQNGYYGSNVQDRDLQQKPKTTKFVSIFNFNMSVILDAKVHKMATMATLFKIETCNKNQTPLTLGQSST